jgi:ribonuclease HI
MNAALLASRATGTALALGALIAALAGCSGGKSASQAIVDSLHAQEAQVATHLTRFDSLDFDVFSNQKWDRLQESHSADIQVHWPDGHTTTGIAQHIEDLKAMFVYAPDTRIQAHPVRFGSGEWTAVTGVLTGTFSHPMPLGGGKFIQPTGKTFSLPMATIGRWKDGVMVEEYLFWDNQTYMKQIGLAHD